MRLSPCATCLVVDTCPWVSASPHLYPNVAIDLQPNPL